MPTKIRLINPGNLYRQTGPHSIAKDFQTVLHDGVEVEVGEPVAFLYGGATCLAVPVQGFPEARFLRFSEMKTGNQEQLRLLFPRNLLIPPRA
jgi:hypothetical protein